MSKDAFQEGYAAGVRNERTRVHGILTQRLAEYEARYVAMGSPDIMSRVGLLYSARKIALQIVRSRVGL